MQTKTKTKTKTEIRTKILAGITIGVIAFGIAMAGATIIKQVGGKITISSTAPYGGKVPYGQIIKTGENIEMNRFRINNPYADNTVSLRQVTFSLKFQSQFGDNIDGLTLWMKKVCSGGAEYAAVPVIGKVNCAWTKVATADISQMSLTNTDPDGPIETGKITFKASQFWAMPKGDFDLMLKGDFFWPSTADDYYKFGAKWGKFSIANNKSAILFTYKPNKGSETIIYPYSINANDVPLLMLQQAPVFVPLTPKTQANTSTPSTSAKTNLTPTTPPAAPQTPPSTPTCVDSDGGKDYMVKGSAHMSDFGILRYISDAGSIVTDYCHTDRIENLGILSEYFCQNDEVKEVFYQCKNRCKDGACIENSTLPQSTLTPVIPPTSVCIDSDGGKNYEVKGTTTVSYSEVRGTTTVSYIGGIAMDYCRIEKPGTLFEYYCYNYPDSAGNMTARTGSTIYTCAKGCKDGACIK